jgi:uncharacterized 2Fe-2S/4Fe-4S cluster protein (DUF4445 family)
MTQVEKKKEEERQELRRLMLIRKYMERAMNGLVRRARRLVDDTDISATQMEKHQISNLLGVALDTGSVEVVINFVRYLVGRASHKLAGERCRQQTGQGTERPAKYGQGHRR